MSQSLKKVSNPFTGGNSAELITRIYMVLPQRGIFIYMPINPQAFKTSTGMNFYEGNVIGKGDVIKAKGQQLRKWSWESVFMADITDPLNLKGITLIPAAYVAAIEGLQKTNLPFNFIYTSLSFAASSLLQMNIKALIESFEYEERGGEPGDIYYSITLREYRKYGALI